MNNSNNEVITAKKLSFTQKGRDFIKGSNNKECIENAKLLLGLGDKNSIEETVQYLFENGYLNPEIYVKD
jgi:hypothetical protein